MVRSKDVTKKKPKDALLTPPSKPQGGGFLDEPARPWSRGGAAVSPAPASVPSYMRGTSSSDAKAGRRGRQAAAASVSASASPARRRVTLLASVTASASPARRRPAVRALPRGKVLFPDAPSPATAPAPGAADSGLARATCSSAMKDAKFPDALDLAPGATVAEGPAALRVCPYTYCSLNGHVHAPAVPLRSFLSSRRRLIKTQQSMKLKGVSAFRKSKSGDKNSGVLSGSGGSGGGGGGGGAVKAAPLIDEEAVGDFFVEVYAGPRVSSDMSCSDMSLDEMDATVRRMEFVVFDRCGADEDNDKGSEDLAVCDDAESHPRLGEKLGACRDSSSECSGADISGDFVEELPWMRYQRYDYDSLDDEISEEQRMREEEAGGAEIFQEQEEEQGTSGRIPDECKEDSTEEHENTSNLICEAEIVADQVVACKAEACKEPDGRDEDTILDTVCHEEPSVEQGTSEEKLPEVVYRSDIHDQEVAGSADSILDESCKEETSADGEAQDDECHVESDGESVIINEQDVKDEDSMPNDVSKMEISEDAIFGDGCREEFSEEVTSTVVREDDSTVNYAFEQYVSTGDDALEQDSIIANDQNDAHKELGIEKSTFEVAYEEAATSQQIDQDGSADGLEDHPNKFETTTCVSEEAFKESGITQESNPSGITTQIELEIATCKSKDPSEEPNVTEDSSLNDNSENVTDSSEMEPAITGCKLEDASEETVIDQGTTEDDDDCACASADAQKDLEVAKCKSEDASEESVEDDNSVCVSVDAQNDLEATKFRSEDASKESFTTEEADQSDRLAIVSSSSQNESELATSELAIIAITDNTQNESELTICKPEDVSEESAIGEEADHDNISACVSDGTQNESDLTTCESEAQEESDIIQEDENEDNTTGASDTVQQKTEITACELGDTSEKTTIPQEAAGLSDTTDANDSTQKDITIPKLDACEDVHITEETNQLFNVQILEEKHDCVAEDNVEPHNLAAEFCDAEEPSIDDICGAFSGMNLKGDVYFDPADSATCPRNKLIISRRRRTPEEEEYLRGFNPRAPNFLPLELDPDAEKVDLKHQMTEERKNAEEWMIDYALRRAVTNLAPARKKKVELLVQAFETVLPHDEDDKKSITPPRSAQACS